jgi:pantoate kinase
MTPVTQRCGGHITLLFTVDKASTLMRSQGSKGAGFSIHHGVEATGTMRHRPLPTEAKMSGVVPDQRITKPPPSPSDVSVRDINGEHIENVDIYLDFIQACYDATLLRVDESIRLEVVLECPRSQGFGMSAAGLIATGRVIHALTGRGRLAQYLKIAHRIERSHGAGLGDVLGASVGGVELRLSPGAPGWPGQAVSFSTDAPVLLAWNPLEERHTSTYIDDPAWQRSITVAGEACVDVLSSGDWASEQWPNLLLQSRIFATNSGMLEEEERAHIYHNVLQAVLQGGWQSNMAVRLCMLGSSVAVLPRNIESEVSIEALEALAETIRGQGFACLITSISPLNHLD